MRSIETALSLAKVECQIVRLGKQNFPRDFEMNVICPYRISVGQQCADSHPPLVAIPRRLVSRVASACHLVYCLLPAIYPETLPFF